MSRKIVLILNQHKTNPDNKPPQLLRIENESRVNIEDDLEEGLDAAGNKTLTFEIPEGDGY